MTSWQVRQVEGAGTVGATPSKEEDRSFMDDYLLTVLSEKDELGLKVDDLEKDVR